MDESWYKLFVLPFVENYEMILLSMSCCFVIQWGTHFLSKIFFPNSYGKLNPRDQLDWCIRAVAIAHAIASWGSIPGALYPSEEIAGKLDSVTGMMVYNHYAFSAESQFYFQIGTGYFLWDIIVSLYYNWGAVYITHGFASFGVFYFSLNPFLHLWGRFYHGVFELSTPWIHLREIMELGGYDGILKTICEGLFALSFTIVCTHTISDVPPNRHHIDSIGLKG